MEWVQTTGKTVDEAKERALDELGVDDRDAEFEVLEEPRSGLFGLTRGEAKVRARVRPASPRPKQERTRRRSGRGRGGSGQGGKGRGNGGQASRSGNGKAGTSSKGEGRGGGGGKGRGKGGQGGQGRGGRGQDSRAKGGGESGRGGEAGRGDEQGRNGGEAEGSGGSRGRKQGGRDQARQDDRPKESEGTAMSEASVEEQAASAEEFLTGLVEAFGLTGTVTSRETDDAVEVAIDGDDLGLLIGPKGRTLWALQELTKTVVQRQQGGGLSTRIRVDVAGYRERRRAALERFTREAAAAVLESGVARSLEPMGAADRKVVHDTVNEIEGVATRSEGEDPRRRVVITPT